MIFWLNIRDAILLGGFIACGICSVFRDKSLQCEPVVFQRTVFVTRREHLTRVLAMLCPLLNRTFYLFYFAVTGYIDILNRKRTIGFFALFRKHVSALSISN